MTTTPHAQALDDDELWSISRLGHAYLERGRLDDARELFTGLTALAPQLAYPWHALGVIARREGQLERAIGCLRHAQQLAPQDTAAHLTLAEVLLDAGQAADARAALAHVIRAAAPGAPDAQRARALMQKL